MSEGPDDADLLREMQEFLAGEAQLIDSLDAVLVQLREDAKARTGEVDRSALWSRIERGVAGPD